MSSEISASAASAREAHRQDSGRFGAQARQEADVHLLPALREDLVEAAENLYSEDPEDFDDAAADALAARWEPDPAGARIIGDQKPQEIAGVFLNAPDSAQEWASLDPAALGPGCDVQAGAAVPVMDLRAQMETEEAADPRTASFIPLAQPVTLKVDEASPLAQPVKRWLAEPHPWDAEGASRADYYDRVGVYGSHQVPGAHGDPETVLITGRGQEPIASGVDQALGVPNVDTELGRAAVQMHAAAHFVQEDPASTYDQQQLRHARARHEQLSALAEVARGQQRERFAQRARTRIAQLLG